MDKTILFMTLLFSMLIVFLQCGSGNTLASQNNAGKGRELFQAKCAQCHSIGGGKKIGPDLQGISERRPKEWLEDFITNPEKMFSRNDPVAIKLLGEYKMKMPALGLSEDDVSAILDFIASEKGVQAAATAVSVSKGNSAVGKKLFTGETAFKKGGAPCFSCHNLAGIRFPGGGNLGPDLTKAYSLYGDRLISVLTNIPFPTMVPIFRRHPIDSEEALNLAAFLKESTSSRPEDFTYFVLSIGLIGFLVLMIIIGFIWRHRLVAVRDRMVNSPHGLSK